MSAPAALAWYVAYGSNLSAERFRVYLEGGTPAGGSRACVGCRDRSPPRADRPVTLPYPLYFGSRSRTWGGGIAFVDPVPAAGTATLARAWLVTREQLEDVVAQERGVPPEPIDPDSVAGAGVVPLGDGAHYGTLAACEPIGGLPALTCTAPPPGAGGPVVAPPDTAYLRVIARGLAEAHGLGPHAAARYLAGAPGVAGAWDAAELVETVTRPAAT